MRQRVNFYFVLIRIVFKKIQLFAGSALKSFAAGYPSAKTIQSLLQNSRFAQVATPIGICKPQSTIGIFARDTLPCRLQNSNFFEAQLLADICLVYQSFSKQQSCVDKQNGDRIITNGQKVQQSDALSSKA